MPSSATFKRASASYRALEAQLDELGMVFGPRGGKTPLFDEWRKLWGALCDLDRRYQLARAGKGAR